MIVTKDILLNLKIKTMYIDDSKHLFISIPIQFYENYWRIYIACNELRVNSVILKILDTDNCFHTVSCFIKKIDNSLNQFILFFKSELPEFIKTNLNNYQVLEKRSGVRILINDTNYKEFGLKSIKQEMVINGIEKSCIINDISAHGLKITFSHKSSNPILLSSIISIIGINLTFFNPLISIFLLAEPVRIHKYDYEQNTLTLGCKIKEPVNIQYLQRVTEFLQILEKREYHNVLQEQERPR